MNHNDVKETPIGNPHTQNGVKETPMENPHTQSASSLCQHFLSYISEHCQELLRKRTEQETSWQIDRPTNIRW